jgi:hypothetical protein
VGIELVLFASSFIVCGFFLCNVKRETGERRDAVTSEEREELFHFRGGDGLIVILIVFIAVN